MQQSRYGRLCVRRISVAVIKKTNVAFRTIEWGLMI